MTKRVASNAQAKTKGTVKKNKAKKVKPEVQDKTNGKATRVKPKAQTKTKDKATQFAATKRKKAAVGKKETRKQPKPRVPKELRLAGWQKELISRDFVAGSDKLAQYVKCGFTIFPGVLSGKDAMRIVAGDDDGEVCFAAPKHGRMVMRRRKGNQRWLGARKMIEACIRNCGGTETVLSPLTTREPGRYDLPLPEEAAAPIMSRLRENRVMDFAQLVCKTGRLRTQDVMLSRPGSTEQRIHTDSSWENRKSPNPRIHYLTILIPLTTQDQETGGTRVWPGSHRQSTMPPAEGYVDMVEPLLNVGDALVFDGLLSHRGMANRSVDRDRYFYYAAFASRHDPNTEVTGS